MMKIWFLWAVLYNGQHIEAGQYQKRAWCYEAARYQRPFWLLHIPPVRRMECELVFR